MALSQHPGVEVRRPVPPALEIRAYQTRIVEQALQAVADGHKYILIESPTGSGKTVMGHLIAQALHQRFGWRAGWTAMRRYLLQQASELNQQMIGLDGVRYFSTFEADPPPGIDFLVDDEAHHSAAATATALYTRLAPKAVLGLSATPFRADQLHLCFSKVIRDAGIRALIEQKWLAPFHQYMFDGDWSPDAVAGIYLKDPSRWGKSVVYFLTLDECDRCARVLRDAGMRCEVVHGDSDQSGQIEAFDRGELDVLLNVLVLTEGFDCPRLRTVFVRPGSKGPTMQMVGRALRKHPDKPFAQVVQAASSPWPFTKIAPAEAKFAMDQTGQWVSRRTTDAGLARAHINTLRTIATTQVRLPPHPRRPQQARRPKVQYLMTRTWR